MTRQSADVQINTMTPANLLVKFSIACCNHSQKHSSGFLSTQRFPGTILLKWGERRFSSKQVLQRLLPGGQSRDVIIHHSSHHHHHLQTTSSKCFSILSKCTRVIPRCFQSNNLHKVLVSQTTRTKYSQSGDEEETPIVFVNKPSPLIGRKTQKKMQTAVPTSAPVVVRSRTKKPTRLGMRDKKDSWLCTAFSTAEEYHLEHLSLDLQSQGPVRPITMPQDAQDVLLMEVISSDADEDKNEPAQIFIFREGSVVFWNVPDSTVGTVHVMSILIKKEQHILREEFAVLQNISKRICDYLYQGIHVFVPGHWNEQKYGCFLKVETKSNILDFCLQLKKVLKTISKHEFRPYEVALVTWENEHINFTYSSQGTKLTDEAIILDENIDTEAVMLEKFAFSNAMALSVKLGIWEASVDKFTSSLESIPESLKRGHRLKMSRVEVMRKTGELFSLRHQINLSSDLLISPDFYWDRDDLDALYNKTCQFYSIGRRTRVTNDKLNHCSELVELMRTHLSERHSLKLEWMIILLISVEVVFEVIRYIQRYLDDGSRALPPEIASQEAQGGRR